VGIMTAARTHAHMEDWLERSCAAVVAAVRSHRALLEVEIYEHVGTRVPELMLDGDTKRQARARTTITAIVGYCLEAIEQGPAALAPTMPQLALERARAAAREGARIGPLLRAVEAGYQPFVGIVIAETHQLPNATLVREHLRETYGRLVGDIAAALEREYECERAGCAQGPKLSRAAHGYKSASALTRRQCEVLELLMAERSYKEIAQALYLTPNTVHTHATRIYRKLGVNGRNELMGR
jgi:DNA-binding CsgD family transcriptional regulator